MKLLIWLLIVIIGFCNTSTVFSHESYVPFLMINGSYVSHHKIPSKSVENFELAHEIAPESYLVLRPITFKVDTFKMDQSLSWIKNTKVTFDFGDGETADGFIIDHTYKKIGTFVVSLYANNQQDPPQLVSTYLVQILPLKNYLIPQPIISVNNQKIEGQTKPNLSLKFDQSVLLDASKSSTGSAKIIDYSWDLGDRSFSKQINLTHKYSTEHYNSFVLLRLKDENGFYNDSYVELINQEESSPTAFKSSAISTDFSKKALTGAVLLTIFLFVFLGYKMKFLSKNRA